jgi:hypothetical protein
MDAERDRPRATADATSGGVLNWLRTHIVVSIIGTALVAVFTGWLTGFFDSILDEVGPSGADAACAFRETI